MGPASATTATATASPRQLKAAETRGRLVTAAALLFSQHGYAATTIDKIAAEAGVAKGTFFVHFKSKDAVVADLVRVQTRSARKARRAALEAKGPLEALRASVMTLGMLGEASRLLSRGVLTASLDSQDVGGAANALFDDLLGDMFQDARAAKNAGLIASHVDEVMLARSLMCAYLGAVLNFATSPSAGLVDLLGPVVDAQLASASTRRRRRA